MVDEKIIELIKLSKKDIDTIYGCCTIHELLKELCFEIIIEDEENKTFKLKNLTSNKVHEFEDFIKIMEITGKLYNKKLFLSNLLDY